MTDYVYLIPFAALCVPVISVAISQIVELEERANKAKARIKTLPLDPFVSEAMAELDEMDELLGIAPPKAKVKASKARPSGGMKSASEKMKDLARVAKERSLIERTSDLAALSLIELSVLSEEIVTAAKWYSNIPASEITDRMVADLEALVDAQDRVRNEVNSRNAKVVRKPALGLHNMTQEQKDNVLMAIQDYWGPRITRPKPGGYMPNGAKNRTGILDVDRWVAAREMHGNPPTATWINDELEELTFKIDSEVGMK